MNLGSLINIVSCFGFGYTLGDIFRSLTFDNILYAIIFLTIIITNFYNNFGGKK